jgi:hypothetical protein
LEFVDFVERQLAPGQFPVLVAHNGKSFDLPVMSLEFEKAGMQWPTDWHWFDTYLLVKGDAAYGKINGKGLRTQVTLCPCFFGITIPRNSWNYAYSSSPPPLLSSCFARSLASNHFYSLH